MAGPLFVKDLQGLVAVAESAAASDQFLILETVDLPDDNGERRRPVRIPGAPRYMQDLQRRFQLAADVGELTAARVGL